MRRLVLFDIDGTLLRSHGAGRAAIRAALVAELGVAGPIDDIRFDGKTDPAIVRELLGAARLSGRDDDERIGAVLARYVGLLEEELARNPRIELLPGVSALLDAIEAEDGALLGLLTGNVAGGARLKLRAAGLDPDRFRVGAFGSDAELRPLLPPIAMRRAAVLMGREPRGDEVVILGDTPADVTCGSSVGARAIGVCTGSYGEASLREAGADAVFGDLAETAAVLSAVFP